MVTTSHRAIAAGALSVVVAAACRSDKGTAPPPPPPPPPPNISIACPASAPPLVLLPGEVKTLSDPQLMGCVRIPASATGSAYLFVPYNANPVRNVTESFKIVVNPGSFVASVLPAPAPAPSPAPSVAPPARFAAALAVTDDGAYRDPVEARIRTAERELFAGRSASSARSPGLGGVTPVFGTLPTTFAVGQKISMYVPDTSTTPKYCTRFETITGIVKSIGTHGVVVQDSAAPAGGFTQVQFDSIRTEFDALVWPTDSAHFGTPSDIDNNGKVVLLFTPLVNALTPKGSPGFTAGFFFSGDLFTTGCAGSNGGELFYLIAPDPTGTINGNVRSTNFVRQTTRGVVAHEFQHMINAGNRLFRSSGPPEEVWLDEGLAHFAEELVGRAARGYSDMTLLDYAATQNPLDPSDYPAFFRQNFARASRYLIGTDTTGPTHDSDASQLGYRGASWAFLRWVADHYASADVAAFTRRLAAGPATGVPNLTAAAGNPPFDQLVAPWLVTLYADHNGVPLRDPVKYQYQSYDFRNVITNSNNGFYPLRPTPIGIGNSLDGRATSSSGSFYLLTNIGPTPATVVQIASPTGSAVSFTGAGLAVLRVN